MSLTNPNKIVTEQRLNEYHNTILPFLGGMPDILANKFAKGDMYSTDEKMIGQWIDGKPLYQKVITGLNASIRTQQYDSIPVNIADMELVVNCTLKRKNTNLLYYPSRFSVNGTSVSAMCDDTDTVDTAIIQYTKTTDSPIEIGNDTDYSTTEKIVGTWIDGKPIYQKTFQIPVSVFSSASESAVGYYQVRVEHNISNCDIVIDLKGQADGNIIRVLPYCYGATAPNTKYFCGLGYSTTHILLECGTDFRQSVITKNTYGAYVTIQYTKTTD